MTRTYAKHAIDLHPTRRRDSHGLALYSKISAGDDAQPGGSSSPKSNETATIDIDGSSTVYRISKAAQEAYSDVKPEVNVVVLNHGTGGGSPGNYLKRRGRYR